MLENYSKLQKKTFNSVKKELSTVYKPNSLTPLIAWFSKSFWMNLTEKKLYKKHKCSISHDLIPFIFNLMLENVKKKKLKGNFENFIILKLKIRVFCALKNWRF